MFVPWSCLSNHFWSYSSEKLDRFVWIERRAILDAQSLLQSSECHSGIETPKQTTLVVWLYSRDKFWDYLKRYADPIEVCEERKFIPTKVKSWDGTRPDFSSLKRVLDIKPEDVATVKSRKLLVKIELEDLDFILRERRIRWYGHWCSKNSNFVI